MVRKRARFACTLGQGVGATSPINSSIIAAQASKAHETGAHRRCLVTGDTGDRSSMLRFVIGPGDEIVPDVAARLPGRGWWLSPRRDIVDRAVAKRLFARAARRPLAVPAALSDRIEALLVQRCIDTIGFARRAGMAVAGYQRVSQAIREGRSGVLLAALDGAHSARRKLAGQGRGLLLVCVLRAQEIGAAFGREHVVNASLGAGPLGRRLVNDANKLAGFRTGAVVERVANPIPPGSGGQNDGVGAQ